MHTARCKWEAFVNKTKKKKQVWKICNFMIWDMLIRYCNFLSSNTWWATGWGSIKLKKTKNSSVLTLTSWTKSGWMHNREQRGSKISWPDSMTPWWSLGASILGISSWRRSPWQQEIQPMGNWDQIGKDLIGLSTARGKDPIIWKPWMDRGLNTLRTLSI